ncbi:MAG: L-fuculose phosphate aldolase [Euryarchaeota archaeon ADurb.BinA087]|nr:MAG: L-fuculose phosphate aldolase [Euryarchaeota archaeon ADurb.BinA087]
MRDAGEITEDFCRIGRRLVTEGLIGANFGNISIRSGDGFYITQHGSYLDLPGELVYVSLEGPAPRQASSECRVHRQIYKETPHRAVVHAHPPHAVALSISKNAISPVDSEGLLFCPCIPVVTGFPGSEELALNVSQGLLVSSVTIARGHGTFAGGIDLDEAYIRTSLAEHSCRILILLKQIVPDAEYST